MLIKALNKILMKNLKQPPTHQMVKINILTQNFIEIEILLFITQHKNHRLISVLTTIIIIPEYASNANCSN